MQDHDPAILALRERLDNDPASVVELFAGRSPEDIAALLAEVDDDDVEEAFRRLHADDEDLAAEVLSLLGRHDVARVLRGLPDASVADVLEDLPTDDATWAIEQLPDERVDSIVGEMEGDEKRELRGRLLYPEDSAGRLMSDQLIALPETDTAGDAIRALQQADEDVTIIYVYVVDSTRRLTGVVSIRRLIRANPDAPLADLTPSKVLSVRVTDDQELVARELAQYDFVCLPVLDASDRLVGVVTHDDVLDVVREEATEDMMQIAGTTADEVIAPSVWRSARIRMPWLFFSLLGGVAAMKILDLHESKLGSLFLSLTLFVPLIVGMGGNVGTQAAIIVVRGLATGRIRMHDALPVFWRELRTAIVIGLAYGPVLMAATLLLLDQTPRFCVVVGLSLIAELTLASAVGSMLPIMFHKLGIDPAVATGPLVTTTMDILGIFTYLTLAGWLLI